uniref:T-box domain-containing protein n=1 Tax=Syphacia muris TaxID=451379 RepID=A0A0N5AG52_9BILA
MAKRSLEMKHDGNGVDIALDLVSPKRFKFMIDHLLDDDFRIKTSSTLLTAAVATTTASEILLNSTTDSSATAPAATTTAPTAQTTATVPTSSSSSSSLISSSSPSTITTSSELNLSNTLTFDGVELESAAASTADTLTAAESIPKNLPLPGNSELLRRVECRLEGKDLWNKFYELSTEMIITKSGR